MMRRYITLFSIVAALATILAGCAKKTDVINGNTVTVDFSKNGPLFVTDNITVNPKDSIQFAYTVNSPTPMGTVSITKGIFVANTTTIDVVKDSVQNGNPNTVTLVHKLVADSVPGNYVYSILVRDIKGVYLGSSRSVVVTVLPDFNYYPNRTIYVPDTVNKTNPCYYAASTGTAYSYTSAGAANSANIDFGYYFNPDTAYAAGIKKAPFGPSIYALNVSPLPAPVSFYDISTWTKNATIFKVASLPTFNSLQSGGGIKQGCITNLKSGAVNSLPVITTSYPNNKRTDAFTGLGAGNIIWFKTAAGKYGAMQINYISPGGASSSSFINVDIKIAK